MRKARDPVVRLGFSGPTRQEWDALDPRVQQVLRTTQPHRAPGATVPRPQPRTSMRSHAPTTRPRTTQRQRDREDGPER